MATGPPIRHYTVLETKKKIDDIITEAIRVGKLATLTLQDDNGNTFPVSFRITQTEHPLTGGHTFVGITDLDVTINVHIDTQGKAAVKLEGFRI